MAADKELLARSTAFTMLGALSPEPGSFARLPTVLTPHAFHDVPPPTTMERPFTAPARPPPPPPAEESSLTLTLRPARGRAPPPEASAVLDKIPEPPQRRALMMSENLVDKIVVKLKAEYNDLVVDAGKKELELTKITEEARSGAARLEEMHAGMVGTVMLRARMRQVEEELAGLVDLSHILAHVLSRIRDEYTHDQAEVEAIRAQLDQAKRAQEAVAMRTIEAREKQFIAREKLSAQRTGMDAAQSAWVAELQGLRAMNVSEIAILRDFQVRRETRLKIPAEVAAELKLFAEEAANEDALEDEERAKRDEAVAMRAEIMQTTLDKLLAASGATSVDELVAFFEDKEIRRVRTLATMAEREGRLRVLQADAEAARADLQEVRFFARNSEAIDDGLRRSVEQAEGYEDKAAADAHHAAKAAAVTVTMLASFLRSVEDRLAAAGLDLNATRRWEAFGSRQARPPRATAVAAKGVSDAEERLRASERERRATIRAAFAERRALLSTARDPPAVTAAIVRERPGTAGGGAGGGLPTAVARLRSGRALSGAGARRPSTALGPGTPVLGGPPVPAAEWSMRGSDGGGDVLVAPPPAPEALRLESLSGAWARDHESAVSLLADVEAALDAPLTALGMGMGGGEAGDGPGATSVGATSLSVAFLDAGEVSMGTASAGGVAPRTLTRLSSLSPAAIATQHARVAGNVEAALRGGLDALPNNNTRIQPGLVAQLEREKEIVHWLLEHQPALRRRLHELSMDSIASVKDVAAACTALGLEVGVSELHRVFALPEMRANGFSSGRFDMAEFLADSDADDERAMVTRADIKAHTAKLLRTKKGMTEENRDTRRKSVAPVSAAPGASAAGAGSAAARRLSSLRRPSTAVGGAGNDRRVSLMLPPTPATLGSTLGSSSGGSHAGGSHPGGSHGGGIPRVGGRSSVSIDMSSSTGGSAQGKRSPRVDFSGMKIMAGGSKVVRYG